MLLAISLLLRISLLLDQAGLIEQPNQCQADHHQVEVEVDPSRIGAARLVAILDQQGGIHLGNPLG